MNPNRVILTEKKFETLDVDDLDIYVFEQIAQKKNLTHEDEYGIINRMDEVEKAIIATHILDAQVRNGGFDQFFFNYGGYFTQEAYEGCMLMGAIEHAKLIEQAIEICNIEHEAFAKALNQGGMEAYQELSEHEFFEHLDDEFYKLKSLTDYRVELIRMYKSKFIEKQ